MGLRFPGEQYQAETIHIMCMAYVLQYDKIPTGFFPPPNS